jgi:branched-chain amino acid transport system substrate-binding protein
MGAGNTFAAENQPVTLGAIYGLTGEWSAYDVPSSRGAKLFVTQANEKGGVLGRPINLIIKDVESSIDKAAKLVDTILSEHPDVPALFGLSDSDMVRAAAKVAAAANRVFVTSGATSPKLPAEVPTYLFLACFGDNIQAAAAAQFAFSKLNARSASIVYDDNYTYTRLLKDYFKRAFEALGGEVRSVVKFDGANNIGAVVDQIAGADIIFLATEAPPDSLLGVKLLRTKGFDQPIVGGDAYDGETVWQDDDSLRDIYYTTHAFFGAENPSALVKAFRADYMAEYGVEPASFAGLGYDTAALLVAAIKNANSTAPEDVLDALSKIQNFQGVTGTISFDGSRIPSKPVTILEVAGGRRHFVEQIVPGQASR